MEVGVCLVGFHYHLRMVDVPHAILLTADAHGHSVVYSADDYCQH